MILPGIYDHDVLHAAGAVSVATRSDGTTHIEPESFDSNGIPAAELRVAKSRKADEMRSAARDARCSGFYSSALGTLNHYSTDNVFGDSYDLEKDREDMIASYLHALKNKDVVGYTVDYPCKGIGEITYSAKTHTAAQMIQVGDDGIAAQRMLRQRLRLRLGQIVAASTVNEVRAIAW